MIAEVEEVGPIPEDLSGPGAAMADRKKGPNCQAFVPPMPGGMPFPMFPFPPLWPWPMPNTGAEPSGRRSPRRRRRSSSSRAEGNCKDSVLVRRNLMGRVIGRGGGVINTIRQDSGARIDAEDRDEDHCEFRITGTEEQVRRAKTMIREQADRVALERHPLGDQIEEKDIAADLEFPASILGALIGPRGSKINEVRETSGAKIQVKKQEERCHVLLTGSDEQVASARELVESIAEEAKQVTEMPRPGEEDERLEFPLAVAGRIIGSRGVQISEVRSRSGAQVKIEKLEETCRVYLGGSPEQVEKAKKMIVSLAEENHLPGRGDAEDTVEIPLSMVGRVIGKGGETVQRLQRESGAKIDVNNQLDPSPVRLSGTRDAITRAKYLLREVLDRAGYTPPEWRVADLGEHPTMCCGLVSSTIVRVTMQELNLR
ncbi:unnamed protein product [Durusdinium trenchii]|uniref:K Homology domain-containing protein n=1 Tax=Durusdinium trenchii TaxID=1381693 RepID=A0ABP0IHJ8_9DINO